MVESSWHSIFILEAALSLLSFLCVLCLVQHRLYITFLTKYLLGAEARGL